MTEERRVRLFQNGRSQALRIPKDFRLDAEEVVIRTDSSGRLIVEPVEKPGLLATLARLPALDDSVPDVDASLPAVEDEPV